MIEYVLVASVWFAWNRPPLLLEGVTYHEYAQCLADMHTRETTAWVHWDCITYVHDV